MSLRQARPIYRAAMAEGVTDRAEIEERIARGLLMSVDEMRRMVAKHLLSLLLAAERDGDGERVAFPSRDDDNRRTVTDLRYAPARDTLLTVGIRMQVRGQKMVKTGKRLVVLAEQPDFLETLFTDTPATAAQSEPDPAQMAEAVPLTRRRRTTPGAAAA